MVMQNDGVLHVHQDTFSQRLREKTLQATHTGGMPAANWRHFEDLPVDEFQPIVFAENPRLVHLLKFAHGEQPFAGVYSHEMGSTSGRA
jgi:hypothetical protein